MLHAIFFSSVLPMVAGIVVRPTGPAHVIQSDAVLLGRVVAHELNDLQLTPAPDADNKVVYRVPLLTVSDVDKGEANDKSRRVAFMAPVDNTNPKAKPNPRPILGRPGARRGPQLRIGMDGMFFLAKHHADKDLYLVQDASDVVQRDNNPDFDKELKAAKRVVELAAKALENLKSDNAQDRFDTAAVLIAIYRDPRFAGGKTEA